MDDAQLVQRAATCDMEAFAHVYDRHAYHLHEFLWWVLQDREEADEALYATFVEAGARIHELADPAKLRPWLFAVASRQALRHTPRRHHHNGNGNGNGHGAPLVDPDRDSSWNELVQVVRAVGEDLSPRDRALIDLKYRQGLRDEDLGAAIGTDPDAAASLVERVTERVEAALGDTVVAYLGQKDCPELQEALGEFDGRLTERQRQVVEQHIEQCERCGVRYGKHVGAPALLRVTPPVAVPPDVTARVLDDVQLAAHSGRPWPASRNGFPPPLARDDRRRWVVAVAAALVLLLGAVGLIATRGDGGGERVAAVGTTVARSASTTRPTTSTVPVTTTAVEPGEGEGEAASGGTSAGPATTVRPSTGTGGGGTGTGTGGAGSGGGGSGGGDPSGGGSGTGTNTSNSSGTSASSPTTAPTTTLPPDTTPPSVGTPSVSPSTLKPSGGGCSNSHATSATVSVTASDPSGISSITVFAGFGGSSTMQAAGGGTYTAVIGPFENRIPAVGVPLTLELPVVVNVVDGAGNATRRDSTFTLRCDV